MLEIMLNKNNVEQKKKLLISNSEQKIIYAEKRVNNFLNNAEHKIILCRMLEIIYATYFYVYVYLSIIPGQQRHGGMKLETRVY